LNDDIGDDGKIDYSISNKVPAPLRAAIAAGKKILVLINPPYAEVGTRGNTEVKLGTENKTGVATTLVGDSMADYGYASRELFAQFLARIGIEMPTATVAMFSTMKYINAPNFEKFRQAWNAEYLGGFVVHNQAFDGLSGKFPIGFLIWKTDQTAAIKTPIAEISVDVLDRSAQAIGEKIYCNVQNSQLLTNWIPRQKPNDADALPLINAITPTTKTVGVRRTKWAHGAIGHMLCDSNDVQHAEQETAVFSSVHSIGHAGGFFITPENLLQAMVVFSVRKLVRPTWLNDRDQFLQPTAPLSDEFKTDSLIWTLFNRGNLTASADDLEWNGQKWSIVNHFIPFTESEVGAPDRFESDFMVQYLTDKTLSSEAQAVLDAGRGLWKTYFTETDVRTVRDQYKLNRSDVGWYQVRNALKARNASGDTVPVNFGSFELAYQVLSDKLLPQVFSLGFLR
jgi:hypothetical protein